MMARFSSRALTDVLHEGQITMRVMPKALMLTLAPQLLQLKTLTKGDETTSWAKSLPTIDFS
jgi:hypothetical protein